MFIYLEPSEIAKDMNRHIPSHLHLKYYLAILKELC